MRKYDKEFKEEAVKLSDEIGVKQATAQLGIPYYSLAEWRQKRKAFGDHAFVGSGIRRDAPLSENERRLLKENAELRKANEILKDAPDFFRQRPETVKPERLYEYITLRRERFRIHTMCRVVKVSESGYYRSLQSAGKPKPWQLLLVKTREIYNENPDNDNYGVGRILLALTQRGIAVSRSNVRRAMKRGGLLHRSPRHPSSLTKADLAAQKAENLICRDFSADAPNQKWLTDITQIQCLDGKLYLAAVLDCYNGEIIGLAMDDNMKKELCIRAFRSACQVQGAYGMILHSDRGSQFTSSGFRKELAWYSATQSMSGTGRSHDNARMESFFATLKKEKLYRIRTERMPMAQVKSIVFRYIMTYYNCQRIYTSNPGGLPPAIFRQVARGLAA